MMVGNSDSSELEGRARPPAVPSPYERFPRSRHGGDASPYLEQKVLPQRQVLGHEVPPWVSCGATYFITVCAENRARQPLVQKNAATLLIESVKFLHDHGDWFVRLFLVMPDHVHGLFSFPADTSIAQRIAAWKGYTHKKCGIDWQERFFDHRLRSDESLDEKAHYIRMNPVRAGLSASPENWPHVFDAFAVNGTAGTPRPT